MSRLAPPALNALHRVWSSIDARMGTTDVGFDVCKTQLCRRCGVGVAGRIASSRECGVDVAGTRTAQKGKRLEELEWLLLAKSAGLPIAVCSTPRPPAGLRPDVRAMWR